MKVLILGVTGMLGHKLAQTVKHAHDTCGTVRQSHLDREPKSALDGVDIVTDVTAEEFESVERVVRAERPEVVINCIGIVKQVAAADDSITSITVNALFPHLLARLCRHLGARLITLSTDCIFSGAIGNYGINDYTDPVDLYGRTKLLGEVSDQGCLTIRTSMIGRQLIGNHGLVEWLLAQNGKTVKGYRKAIFSGLTTNALATILANIIQDHPQLTGIWHVSAEPINKFKLLNLIKEVYDLDVEIIADDAFVCDRSLNGIAFREATSIVAPHWPDMIGQMKKDLTIYPSSKLLKC